MKQIIDGKLYDTETAELVVDISLQDRDQRAFDYDDTQLYRTRKGQFFVAGVGGATSRWRVQVEGNMWGGGSGLHLIDEDDARALVERFGSPETFIRFFGEPEEG